MALPWIVLPTYNERVNLPIVVRELLDIEGVRVLVVDDRSPDGTGEVAEELARTSGGRVSVLHRTGEKGLGRAYRDGIRYALQGDADPIIQMDADLSHRPVDLRRLLAASERADLVIGSRYVRSGRIVNWPLRRIALSRGANAYIRTITGLPVRDCTSGFRCWRRHALEAIHFERVQADGYAFLVELLWEANRVGCEIVEAPITFVERRHGASKLNSGVLLESLALPWRLVRRHAAGRPSTPVPSRRVHSASSEARS